MISLNFFNLISSQINVNSIRRKKLKVRLNNTTYICFCDPKKIVKKFEKVVKKFNTDANFNLDCLMNALMYLQPYQNNNILLIRYFISIYKLIINGTFTFWKYSVTPSNFYRVFTFQAKIKDLCNFITEDTFYFRAPHWPDIIVSPNLPCRSFILMCKCLNQFDINTNPIIIGIRNIELHVISSDSETDTTNHEMN